MSSKKRFFLLVGILVCVTLIGTGVGLTALYGTLLWGTQRGQLDIVNAYVRTFETLTGAAGPGLETPETKSRRTQSIVDSLSTRDEMPLGRLIFLARQTGNRIEFIFAQSGAGNAAPDSIPADSEAAEPFRRAFAGETGHMIGTAFDGSTAAIGFAPVRGTDVALVRMLEMRFLRLPYVTAGTLAGAAALIAILIGAYFFHRINGHIISHLESEVDQRTRDLARELEVRKEREAAMLESEEKFRRAFEDAETGILLSDTTGVILQANRAFCEMLGREESEIIGQRAFADLTHPDDVATSERVRVEALARGADSVHEEKRYLRKDGSTVWASINYSFISDAQGKHVLTVGHALDITERKRAEEEKALFEGEMRQMQKLEAIGQLAAGIAHEINTPIQYIGDNLRFIKEACPNVLGMFDTYAELKEAAKAYPALSPYVEKIDVALNRADLEFFLAEAPESMRQSLSGVEQVTRIVRAMQEFSHPGQKEKMAANLNRALENTITVCRNAWKHVAVVDTDFDPNLPDVECVVGEINQVFLNLIINASHAIEEAGRYAEDGEIRVSTRRDGDWVEIRIGDNGKGIPAGIRARVFDPFFTTKDIGKGTGQGLAMSYDVVVNKHGGRIDFESRDGAGTEFTVRLPILATDTASEAA